MTNFSIATTGYWQSNNNIEHTCCEPLCNWIIAYFGNDKHKPVYDFGCGKGHYLRRLQQAGFTNLTGIEGQVPQNSEFNHIIAQDLTQLFVFPQSGNCIFLEVAEHVPAQFEGQLLDNVINACGDRLVMSWAIRGQGGDGHINELNNEEVIPKITAKGMIYLPEETKSARTSIPAHDYCWWFRNTTLVFKKDPDVKV